MSSHSKALEKAKKHSHKKGKDGKCEICNMVMEHDGKLDEKGRKLRPEFGAKNNDSEED
jgi:hypothetical protein